MGSVIDHTAIRAAKDLAAYLRQALADHGAKAVSADLLAATKEEALPPSVLSLWLNISYNTDFICDCLKQQFARTARLQAIKAFLKVAGSPRLEALWSSIGGVTGLVRLFTGLAVDEVQDICRGLGSLGFREERKASIRRYNSDLYTLLSSSQNTESRSLQHHYDLLIFACNDEQVLSYINRTSGPVPKIKKIVATRPELFQRLLLESLHDPEAKLPFDPAPLFKDSAPNMKHRTDVLSCRQLAIRVLIVARSDPKLGNKENLLTTTALRGALKWLGRRQRNHASAADLEPMRLLIATLQQRNESRLVETMAPFWGSSIEHLEEILIEVISHSSAQQPSECLSRIVHRLQRSARLRFVKLMYLHSRSSKTDIDDDAQLSKGKARFDYDLFLTLDKDYALSLLDRLETLCDPVPISSGWWNPKLRIVLLRGTTEGLAYAKLKIEEQRKNAVRQHDADARGTSARAMLEYAAAAGSLDLFLENLKWCRRYDKDHTNAPRFYGQEIFNDTVIDLLVGFTTKADHQTTTQDIAENVMKGNAILLAVLEASCAAAKEPSFTTWSWARTVSHLPRVVEGRLKIASALQTRYSLTDDETYTVLWKDLLRVCSIYQETIYSEHNKTLLGACNTAYPCNPPFFGHMFQLRKEMVIPASCRFFNDLMIARDKSWQSLRRHHNTDVLALPVGWPRGLAVQQLLPCLLDEDTPTHGLTFLVERAEKVVFMEPTVAHSPLPEDSGVITAIGGFIDSYESARKIWTMDGADEEDRKRRKRAALEHALTFAPESVNRAKFWYRHFQEPYPVPEEPNVAPLPSEDEVMPVEWNPQPGLLEKRDTSRKCRRRFIDACFNASGSPALGGARDQIPTHNVASCPPEPFSCMFDNYHFGSRSEDPRAKETVDVAALLVVEASHRLGDKLLSTPFPSADDVRYPAVYLDSQFYEHPGCKAAMAMSRVRRSTEIPTALLLRLISSLLAAAKTEKESADKEIAAFNLIDTLIDGDRPHVALAYLKKLFFDFSEHSARHRQILTQGLLRRLPPAAVRNLLLDICETISAKLQQKRDASAGTDTGPAVKISSIKAVVQVLAGCDAVSAQDSLSMLRLLLTSSRHVDVRTAIIGNLQTLLLESKDPQMQDTIIGLFASLVPVAAALDERVAMTEETWQSAESKGEVPSVESCGILMPSLMSALLRLAISVKAAKAELSPAIMERILMPTLTLSIKNQQRWGRLYINTLGVSNEEATPAVPVHPGFLTGLCNAFPDALPVAAFESLATYLRAMYSPRTTLLEVNKLIKESRVHKDTEAAKYWLHMWKQPNLTKDLVNTARSLLKNSDLPVSGNHITVTRVQDFWTDCAMLYLNEPVLYSNLSRHISAIDYSLTASFKEKTAWLQNCRPVLASFAAHVQSLRTPEWQLDTNRQPAVLPEELDLQLMLLAYPQLPYYEDAEQKSAVFVREVLLILKTVLNAGRPYHHVLPRLRQALCTVVGTSYLEDVFDQLVAVEDLGSATPPLLDWLRLELACVLLNQSSTLNIPATSAFGKRLTQIIGQLAKNPIEEFRAYAPQLSKHFAQESGRGRKEI